MQTEATHFIEQVNFDGIPKMMSIQPISKLKEAERIGKKFNVNTVCFFKVYPKVKPALAHYDNELNAIIVE